MKCVVVTPERTVLSQEASFVVLPLFDGEYGVLPNHAPLIARLGAGELRITGMDGQLMHYYIEGGFAEVLDNTVALLSMYAFPAKELNLAEAEKELEEMQAKLSDTPELLSMRLEKINQHRAKVRVAQRLGEKR